MRALYIAILAYAACGIPLAASSESDDGIETFPWPRPLPDASASTLPRWRGFNVQYKFHRDESNFRIQNGPDNIAERDFRMIAELGFNFVRVPLDYRIWSTGIKTEPINETALEEIDRIVSTARKYALHVNLSFHRAPGWTVHQPREDSDLWSNTRAQDLCAMHWAAFAQRFRGIPNRELSFNLINEPGAVDAETHLRVMRRLVSAVRSEDPDRLIVLDGLNYGTEPDVRLRDLDVAMSTRGYLPYELSHYKAEWMGGMMEAPLPTWPGQSISGFLAGSHKRELQKPLEFFGPVGGSRVTLSVASVSRPAHLVVTTQSGEQIWQHRWPRSLLGGTQPEIGGSFSFDVPEQAEALRFSVESGDWLVLQSLKIQGPHGVRRATFTRSWGRSEPLPVNFAPHDPCIPFQPAQPQNRDWLEARLENWTALKQHGIGTMVGELGAYKHTPHDVVLAWMSDLLGVLKDAEIGWALWEFRGPFGVLDSNRADARYVTWNGHQVDVELLRLLQAN